MKFDEFLNNKDKNNKDKNNKDKNNKDNLKDGLKKYKNEFKKLNEASYFDLFSPEELVKFINLIYDIEKLLSSLNKNEYELLELFREYVINLNKDHKKEMLQTKNKIEMKIQKIEDIRSEIQTKLGVIGGMDPILKNRLESFGFYNIF